MYEAAPTTPAAIAEHGLILRCIVGSKLLGTNLDDVGDQDEMGVCIEPPERMLGLSHFEQFIYRSAEERQRQKATVPHGHSPRSEPGDLDLTVYGLNKYVRLAVKGNPSLLVLLFAPPSMMVYINEMGMRLQAAAELFAARSAGKEFLGYLGAQRERLLGQRGQMRVTRLDLIEKHGYDVKFASHALRLGYQGVEFLSTGRLTLPMRAQERDHCVSVRQGAYSLTEITAAIEDKEKELRGLLQTSKLPAHPDAKSLDQFLVRAYNEWWQA